MMMYRPFLHYVSQECETKKVDQRSYACAAACVSVARNIVHITAEMKRRGLLIGSYWFVMYTAYFSILSLVFFVFENPRSHTGNEIMKDATEGRDTLASLAKRSLAADRCTHSLKVATVPLELFTRTTLTLGRAYLLNYRSSSRSVRIHHSPCLRPANDQIRDVKRPYLWALKACQMCHDRQKRIRIAHLVEQVSFRAKKGWEAQWTTRPSPVLPALVLRSTTVRTSSQKNGVQALRLWWQIQTP